MGWTLINDLASSQAFATAIGNAARPFGGSTAPGSAINFAVPLFNNNGFDGLSQIIDVSGDGRQNEGANTATARDNALLAGIQKINGLAILGEAGLLAWYDANIKGGAGAFVEAATFDTFAEAIEKRLLEKASTPPSPAACCFWELACWDWLASGLPEKTNTRSTHN